MTFLTPDPSQTEPIIKQPKEKRSPPLRPLLLIGLVLAGGVGFWFWQQRQTPSSSVLRLSGRIEGYETDIGAKVPGRIASVAVREGDLVKKGQVLVQLDDDELQAQLRAAIAQVSVSQQQAAQARGQINILESQIEEAQLNFSQSQGDAQGRIAQAQSQVAAAQAQLDQAKSQVQQAEVDLDLARKERDRFSNLLKVGAVSQQRLDQADSAYQKAVAVLKTQRSGVQTAQKQVQAFQGAFVQAKTNRFNPGIRSSRIDTLRKQVIAAQSQWKAAQEQVKSAQANRQQVQTRIADLAVKSPIAGVVLNRTVEPGAVVASSKTLLTVINPETIYLRGFIPEGQIGSIRIGQGASVFLDSAPKKPLKAHVIAIDTAASFTPENIYFKDDRVRQVFGVKLGIDRPGGLAKPGMPADAEIQPKASF
jgi:HlyD family secretion protein